MSSTGRFGGGSSQERTALLAFPCSAGKIQGIYLLPGLNTPNLARANAQNPGCLSFNSLQIRTGNFPGRTAKTITGTGTGGRFMRPMLLMALARERLDLGGITGQQAHAVESRWRSITGGAG